MMPGMSTHRRRIDWRAIGRTAGIVAVVAILGLLTLGLLAAAGVSSYDNLFHLAASRNVPIPHLSPLEIDVGLVVVIALDIVLTWLGHPIGGLRLLARILGIGTIAANVAAGWPDPVGASMRAFAPVIIVAVTEALRAFLLRRHRDAAEEGVPFSRWVLAPWPTFVLWRRMKLWDIHGYRAAVDMELSRRQAIVRLEMQFGSEWKVAAPADLVWMLRAGVRMPEALARVRDLTGAKAARRSAQGSGNTQAAATVTPEPAAPETVSVTPPPVVPETEAAVAGEGARKRTDEEWLEEVRRLHADQGDALSVRKLMPQLKLLGGGSAIAIARATDMLRQVKAEAGPDQASEEAV
jgi:hypothetical protein